MKRLARLASSCGDQTARIVKIWTHSGDLATVSFEPPDARPSSSTNSPVIALDFSNLDSRRLREAPAGPVRRGLLRADVDNHELGRPPAAVSAHNVQEAQRGRHAYRHAVRDLAQTRCPQSSLLESTRVQCVEHTVVGVTGAFAIQPAGEVKMLCVAGEVGMSPFVSAKGGCNAGYLVHGPTVTLQLLSTVAPPGVRIEPNVFASVHIPRSGRGRGYCGSPDRGVGVGFRHCPG